MDASNLYQDQFVSAPAYNAGSVVLGFPPLADAVKSLRAELYMKRTFACRTCGVFVPPSVWEAHDKRCMCCYIDSRPHQ